VLGCALCLRTSGAEPAANKRRMSLTAAQRANLIWSSRPPGPASFYYALGAAVKQLGAVFDSVGVTLQGDSVTHEKLPIPTTAIKLDGKAPKYPDAAFIAPSANLVGAVQLGVGSSVWYSTMVQGGKAASDIGEMSNVGDRSIVVDSIVGKHVCIGAGSIITSAKVGDESSIGMGCKVLKGSSMGSRAILVAGSVLPAGTSIPSGEIWAGSPAKKIGAVTETDVAGIIGTAELTAEMAKMHMEEAWKEGWLIEQDKWDYKRQRTRTPEVIARMREDPKWVPMPTLGGFLGKLNIHAHNYVVK